MTLLNEAARPDATDLPRIYSSGFSHTSPRAFRAAPVALAVTRIDDGVVIDANERYLELFGFARREEVVGRRDVDLGIYIDRRTRGQLMRRLKGEGKIEAMPLAFRAASGEARLTLVSMVPVEIDGVRCAVAMLRNIMADPRAGPGDAVDERRWSTTLLERYLDALVVLVDGRFVYANELFTRLSGYSVRELIQRSPEDLVAPKERALVRRRMEELGSAPGERIARYQLLRKDGTVVPVEALSRRIEFGDRVAILSAVRDISQRLHAEEALRRSEERFRLLAEHAQDMVFRYRMTEPRGFEYVSPAVTAIAGYSPQDYYDDPDFARKIVHPDDLEEFRAMIRNRSEEPVELRWVCRDGGVIWTERRCIFLDDGQGNIVAVEGIVRDVTARKLAERELQAAKDDLETRIEGRLRERGDTYELTVRELSVLQLVAGGMTDKGIARELGISIFTAQKHLSNILQKMGAACRTEAVARAVREGLVE